MEFACYTSWEQLPDDANNLFAVGEKNSLFLSRTWFENLSAHVLEDKQDLILACVIDNNNVLAILPLIQQDNKSWRTLSNFYTSFYSLLIKGTNQQLILDCLANGLNQLSFETLRLDALSEDDPVMDCMQHAFESSGHFKCHRYPRFYNWYQPLNNLSFDGYVANRPARLRNTIARKKESLKENMVMKSGYSLKTVFDRRF